MKKNNFKAFSLMELMVVITIIGIVSVFTYTPYIFYKNKANVNISTKTLSQSIYLARQLAINGVSSGTGNTTKNMNIYLSIKSGKNGKIALYGFTGSSFNPNSSSGILIKKVSLESNVWVKKIEDNSSSTSYSGAIFYFSAIKGKPTIYGETSSNYHEVNGKNIKIILSYKGSNSEKLSKTITYYKDTYVIDN